MMPALQLAQLFVIKMHPLNYSSQSEKQIVYVYSQTFIY